LEAGSCEFLLALGLDNKKIQSNIFKIEKPLVLSKFTGKKALFMNFDTESNQITVFLPRTRRFLEAGSCEFLLVCTSDNTEAL
jgi:hypothetical protein